MEEDATKQLNYGMTYIYFNFTSQKKIYNFVLIDCFNT